MRRFPSGYTLLELLIVLAILAALFTLGLSAYQKARWRAEVREGLATLAATLRDARVTAQRFDVHARVRFTAPRAFELEARDRLGNPLRSYRRGLSANLELDYSKDGRTWRPITALGTVTYTAPFGETAASATLMRVRHKRDPNLAACLRLVGVTGKVVMARACP